MFISSRTLLSGSKEESMDDERVEKSLNGGKKTLTDIDRMLEEVKRRGRVSLDEMGGKFGISKDLAEEWAEVLEGKGLISVDYAVGRPPVLVAKKAGAAKPAAKTVRGERPRKSRQPTVIISGILIIMLAVLLIQASGLFNFKTLFSSESRLNLSQGANIASSQAYVIANVFKRTSSATYSASVEEVGTVTDYGVYLDAGRVRVEIPAADSYMLFDGNKYYYNNNGTVTEVAKKWFEEQTDRITPWTYLDLMGSARGTSRSFAGDRECVQFVLENGIMCVSEAMGFPLSYMDGRIAVSFTDVDLKPEIDNSIFEQ